MNFIDWCEKALRKLSDLDQSNVETQSDGIDEATLFSALFGDSDIDGRLRAIHSAINELKALGFVHDLSESSDFWELTEAGRRAAKSIRPAWREICAVDLKFAEQRQLLAILNRLSQQSDEGYAWLEYVESDRLRADLPWASDWVQFRAAARRLVDLNFASGEFYSQAIDLRSTYRGLVWESRCVKSKLFISYRREPSEAYALLLSEKLSQYGMSVFVDTLTVEGAELFPERLEKGIADADIVVCLLGPGTLDSEWVRREIEKAEELGKPLIPVFQPGFDPPDTASLSASISKLLAFEGVKINSGYVNEAIDKLAVMIENTGFKQFLDS